MVVFPNAKINLGLNITSRRPDGYHELITAMIPVPWCDILEIVPAKGGLTTLTVSGRDVRCQPQSNLVMKAFKAIGERTEVPPVDIFLHKIIPDGAGLGGGSADAAFTLTALNDLFVLGMDKKELSEIAAGLGADCPFFIYNKPMLGSGIGTTLEYLDGIELSGITITIVKPALHISTAQAYAGVTPRTPDSLLTDILRLPATQWRGRLINDFEESLHHTHPEIDKIKQSLYDCGAIYASLSGSGSAVYGLFTDDKMAEKATACHDNCATFVGKLTDI